jgi:threonine/homoserine/homoserine lactone efflux protein
VLVVPGPAVLYVVTRSVEHGRHAGFASVFGIATGGLVHVAAAALGLSALLAGSATDFTAMKLAGAAYLIALGVRKFLTAGGELHEAMARASLNRIYRQGVVVQALNPKAALFFLAFLPQFVDPARGSVALQVVALGLVFVILGIASDGTWALLTSSVGTLLRRQPAFRRRSERLAGIVYISLGITAALAGRPAHRAGRSI